MMLLMCGATYATDKEYGESILENPPSESEQIEKRSLSQIRAPKVAVYATPQIRFVGSPYYYVEPYRYVPRYIVVPPVVTPVVPNVQYVAPQVQYQYGGTVIQKRNYATPLRNFLFGTHRYYNYYQPYVR